VTVPLHSELARELAEGIISGTYPVGSLLPTELELCEQRSLSRYAVRKAMDELQELGLISRRKNVGTRVESARPATAFVQSVATVDELAQYGARHVRTVLATQEVVMDLALAEELDCAGGSRWLRISSVRMDGAIKPRPIGWTDVYIDPRYTKIGKLVRKSPELLVSSLIEQHYGRSIARIRQLIDATSLSEEMARVLQAEPGSPALKITRHYLDTAQEVFEISVSVHPAKRFTFETELSRSKE
jgi:GntR family transcriptional regulator